VLDAREGWGTRAGKMPTGEKGKPLNRRKTQKHEERKKKGERGENTEGTAIRTTTRSNKKRTQKRGKKKGSGTKGWDGVGGRAQEADKVGL